MKCRNCRAWIGPLLPDDVVRCTCGQWYNVIGPISPAQAAAEAAAPLPPDEVLAALETSENAVTILS